MTDPARLEATPEPAGKATRKWAETYSHAPPYCSSFNCAIRATRKTAGKRGALPDDNAALRQVFASKTVTGTDPHHDLVESPRDGDSPRTMRMLHLLAGLLVRTKRMIYRGLLRANGWLCFDRVCGSTTREGEHGMTEDQDWTAGLQRRLDRPSSARIYDYLLEPGSPNNYAIDRAFADRQLVALPDMRKAIRENRRSSGAQSRPASPSSSTSAPACPARGRSTRSPTGSHPTRRRAWSTSTTS